MDTVDHGRTRPGPSMVPSLNGGFITTASSSTVASVAGLDDRSVVDAVLGGDRDAFRVLVDREAAAVIRACHRVLGDVHEAEDAAQEAFVTAFQSLAGWRGDGPFGAWLTRIAVRIAVRRAQRRRDVTWLEPGQPNSIHVSGGPDPAI